MTPTEQAKALVERLTELLAKCPVLPLAARPQEHDDWGLIRTTVATEDGWYPVFARANIPWDNTGDDKLNEHRRNKTDPTQHAMDLIVEGLNALPELLALASVSPPVDRWREGAEAAAKVADANVGVPIDECDEAWNDASRQIATAIRALPLPPVEV